MILDHEKALSEIACVSFDLPLGVDVQCSTGSTALKKAAEVKRKAEALSPHAAISVIPIHGEEEYGKFLSCGAEEFTFYDVDSKTEVTLKYAEIRKIKNGYGGYNFVRGRHTDRTKGVIVTLAFVAALGALIGAVASAKD